MEQLAIPADCDFVKAFGKLAAELDMAIAVTFLEKHAPQPRNTVALYDRRGERRLLYAKVHTCDFGAELVLAPNACPMEINRLSQLRGRAFENMMGIAT